MKGDRAFPLRVGLSLFVLYTPPTRFPGPPTSTSNGIQLVPSALSLYPLPARLLALSTRVSVPELTTCPPHSQSPPLSSRDIFTRPTHRRTRRWTRRSWRRRRTRWIRRRWTRSVFASLLPSHVSSARARLDARFQPFYRIRETDILGIKPHAWISADFAIALENRRWWTRRRLLGSWRCWWRSRWWIRWWTRWRTPWRWTWWRA